MKIVTDNNLNALKYDPDGNRIYKQSTVSGQTTKRKYIVDRVGDLCRKWVNLDEPLMHSKTAFPIILLGNDEVNRLKDLQRKLNRAAGKTKPV